jgi:hypothetical protein
MPYVQDPQTTYVLLLALVAAHITINYYAVRAVVFRSFNRQRTSILWDHFRKTGGKGACMPPREVARKERIFARASVLFRYDEQGNRRKIGRCDIGSSLSSILSCHPDASRSWLERLRPHRCPWYGSSSAHDWMPTLLRLFNEEKYVLWFDVHINDASFPHLRAVLKTGHTPRDHMKAWVHATELASLRHAAGRTADISTLLEELQTSKTMVDGLFDTFVTYARKAKWDTEAAAGGLITGSPYVINEVTADESVEGRKDR